MKILCSVQFLAFAILASACATTSTTPGLNLESRLRGFLRDHGNTPAVALVVVDGGRRMAAASAGAANPRDPSPVAFAVDTPVRIASITKTYVAATVLRLWEAGRIDLDAPLTQYMDPPLAALLRSDGYVVDRMTIRQLLSQSSGLFDYAASDEYVEGVLNEPAKVWTRGEQIRFAVDAGEPLGAPGEQFHYSDTGYLILGQIIERVTGSSLAVAAREQLRFDELSLDETWWELVESPPVGSLPRAHQYFGGVDTYPFHPSFDLYGGGGLVASIGDVADFHAALFEGRLFQRPGTLAAMTSAQGPADPAQYRLGLQVSLVTGKEAFGHNGFWGTTVLHIPGSGLTIAGVVTEQEAFSDFIALVRDLAQQLVGR